VLVSGEPGIGKSRLTAALSQRIGTEPHIRIRYFCSPHDQDSALYPFIGQLGVHPAGLRFYTVAYCTPSWPLGYRR
jgi:predicted ATPase